MKSEYQWNENYQDEDDKNLDEIPLETPFLKIIVKEEQDMMSDDDFFTPAVVFGETKNNEKNERVDNVEGVMEPVTTSKIFSVSFDPAEMVFQGSSHLNALRRIYECFYCHFVSTSKSFEDTTKTFD